MPLMCVEKSPRSGALGAIQSNIITQRCTFPVQMEGDQDVLVIQRHQGAKDICSYVGAQIYEMSWVGGYMNKGCDAEVMPHEDTP